MGLDQLATGKRARILHLGGLAQDSKKKLMAIGLLPNAEFTLARRAPFGGPLQLRAKGISVALRKEIASQIQVEEV